MGEIGFDKLLLIVIVVLVLFGAKRVPEIGASIGKGIREFKRSLSDTDDATLGRPANRSAMSGEVDRQSRQPAAADEPKRLSQ
ncbi:MAG: twin-arginine translocase TatA/TatE family subunit [Deltaproteobacteria bacterium]